MTHRKGLRNEIHFQNRLQLIVYVAIKWKFFSLFSFLCRKFVFVFILLDSSSLLKFSPTSCIIAWVWFLAYFEACCLNLHRKFERKEVGKQIRNRISDDLFLMIGLIPQKHRDFLSQIRNVFMTLQTKSFFMQ